MKKTKTNNLIIIYEDRDIIAFDKPSGIPVVPERDPEQEINLMRLVHENFSNEYSNVHRLDKEASGVLLVSKNRKTMSALSRLFELKDIEKTYVTLTLPGPKESKGVITIPLSSPAIRSYAKSRGNIKAREKTAETSFKVLERFRGGYTFLQIHPRTGRTHQIRIHLANIGCHILGDPLYGEGKFLFLSSIKSDYKFKKEAERPLINRLALHAESLKFRHPSTGEEIIIRSSLPKDFQLTLKYLHKYA